MTGRHSDTANPAESERGVQTCAEELLYLLAAHGVEYLFLNPGTDSAPIQEAAVALGAANLPAPSLVACSFESVSLAAAHGYWQATRRPQAVWVHVDAGTQNLGAMVHNIMRDRAGVVVLAGKTPYGEDTGHPGGRSSPIHWLQDVPDQAAIVRSYAKWTAELVRATDVARFVGRAVQLAGGGIPGLAYMMVSRDVLMEEAAPPTLRRTNGWALPHPPAMSPEAVSEVAKHVAEARRPVLVTTRLGRRPGAAEALGRFADTVAIPVVTRPEAVNLVTTHPMLCRDPREADELLSSADLILIVEADVPWVPARVTPAQDATIIHIGPDPLHTNMPMWTFPVDLAITADGGIALRQLQDAMEQWAPRSRAKWEERRRARSGTAGAGPTPQVPQPAPAGDASLDAELVIRTLDGLLRPDDVVMLEAVTNAGTVGRYLTRLKPETLYSSGGPGLGWAMGASVGAKLASPGRRVVAIVGDGAFMFGVPTASFCLAAEVGAAFLVVILNNEGYRASRMPVFELFPGGYSVKAGEAVGTRFRQAPDAASVARACGGWGERVSDPSRVAGALRAGLGAVERGMAAVVDIHIDSE